MRYESELDRTLKLTPRGGLTARQAQRAATLARLHAALESVETTRKMVAEIRSTEPLAHANTELAGVVELVQQARELLRTVIISEAD